jgi:putative phage-type endonuclease
MQTEIQNQNDWLKWRQSGVGGSDAPILTGESDWSTPLELFKIKISEEVVESEGNYATDLGNEAEPKIRSLHEFIHNKEFKPCLVQSANFPFVIASLDGRTEDKKEASEYKLLNKKDWERAKKWFDESKDPKKAKDYVPAKYYTQMQHQMMADPGLERNWFVAYLFSAYKENRKKPLELKNIAIVEVLPDRDFQAKLLMLETEFWQQHVLVKKPPLPSAKDVKKLSAKKKVDLFLEIKKKHDLLTAELKKAESELKKIAEEAGHPKVDIDGVKFTKVAKAGSFNVKKVPAAAAIQEEADKKIKAIEESLSDKDKMKFTTEGTTYWKMTIPKEKKNGSEKKS